MAPEERPTEDLLVCERGHHIRTRTALIICPARGEGAHDGVFGPACGADIVSMVLPIGEFAEAVAAAHAEGEQAERIASEYIAACRDQGLPDDTPVEMFVRHHRANAAMPAATWRYAANLQMWRRAELEAELAALRSVAKEEEWS